MNFLKSKRLEILNNLTPQSYLLFHILLVPPHTQDSTIFCKPHDQFKEIINEPAQEIMELGQ